MSVGAIIFLSCVTVAAFVFLLLRLMPWRLMLRLAVPIDVLFSITALFAFGGTMTGTCVAITSGLILAIFLTVCRSVSRNAGQRWTYIPPRRERKARKPLLSRLRRS